MGGKKPVVVVGRANFDGVFVKKLGERVMQEGVVSVGDCK